MIEYTNILNSIKKCEGGLVLVMLDSNYCNYEFLKSLAQELHSEYKIEYNRYDIKTIDVKTIIFIDILNIPKQYTHIGSKNVFFRSNIGNENVILIALKKINLAVTPISLYGGEETYAANIILSLKNKKLTVVKSRYSNLQYSDPLDISNMTKLVRKIKLNKINKK